MYLLSYFTVAMLTHSSLVSLSDWVIQTFISPQLYGHSVTNEGGYFVGVRSWKAFILLLCFFLTDFISCIWTLCNRFCICQYLYKEGVGWGNLETLYSWAFIFKKRLDILCMYSMQLVFYMPMLIQCIILFAKTLLKTVDYLCMYSIKQVFLHAYAYTALGFIEDIMFDV